MRQSCTSPSVSGKSSVASIISDQPPFGSGAAPCMSTRIAGATGMIGMIKTVGRGTSPSTLHFFYPPLSPLTRTHLALPPASFPGRGSITRGRDGQLLPKGSHRKSNGCSVESSCSPRRLRQGRARDHIRRASCSSCPRNVQGTIRCKRKKWLCSKGHARWLLSTHAMILRRAEGMSSRKHRW
ncbi:hypothetical protein BGY98DRAFT_1053540 [Russula aff. rugulosa BPL654]|nr:hypothetical protein BGY98DRAFT_1053540 [Russula aff. rugulosa BPL654]